MIDLEDTEMRERIAVGERVEAGAENDVLAHTIGDRGRERVLRDPAADCEERAQHRRDKSALELRRVSAKRRCLLGADDTQRQRVFVDERSVDQLVCRAAERDTLRGVTRAAFDHRRSNVTYVIA
jgi:hypothetical protein